MEKQDTTRVNRAAAAPGVEEVRARLILDLSRVLGIEPSELDIRQSVFSYGLDSLAAVTLMAGLEEWLDVPLPATLVWDFRTVETLSERITALAGEAWHGHR